MAYTNIDKSSLHFNTKTYTGNGTSLAVTGVGFQPDWLWIKQRNTTRSHQLMDSVRGASYRLHSDQNVAQSSSALTSFDSDGFTVDGTSLNGTNQSSGTYVAWNWKAGGSGSSNTDGSITSTVSVNQTAGFSIVKYNGTGANATVGHGLGVKPSMIICKRLNSTGGWISYHSALGATKYLYLDNTDAEATNSTVWQDTEPTTSVFSVGTASNCNASGGTYVAYCFAEKKGFSKFGTYTGNGNADGAFIYTGFKPAFVIIKRTDTTANWVMTDNKISFNGKGTNNSTVLFPSTNAAESDAYGLMLHSNGFKFSGSDSASATVNGSGGTYIYMAFAEAPLVGSNNVPATAR